MEMAVSKVWNIVRIVVFMLKKGIAKSKPKLYLNLLVKRGKIFAGKAIMLHHHYAAAFTCRSQESRLSFISPSDYEFSCSNTPDLPFRAITNNSINRKRRSKNKHYKYDDVSAFHAFRKVLVDDSEANLPGFRPSTPFMLKEKDDDGDAQVDKAAEEFIKRFYIDLNLQKRMAASDSPYSSCWDR